MATMFGMAPVLNMRRSAQSGLKVMTAAWQVVYIESTAISQLAYFFAGAEINLSPMQAGDTINIRVRKILVAGGGWVNHDQQPYNGPMPATHQSPHIGPLPNVFGIEIAMQQTAGVLRTIECDFYDMKRLGLA